MGEANYSIDRPVQEVAIRSDSLHSARLRRSPTPGRWALKGRDLTTDTYRGADPGRNKAAGAKLEPSTVNVRIKISALWTSMLFVFVYVDLFSIYRPDYRADLEAGTLGGFTVNQSFLLGTTAYVVIPSLMVFLTLVLRPRVTQIANIVLGIAYAVTIIGGAIGEWNYYVLGSAIEVMLLAAIVFYAWTWPKEAPVVGSPAT